MRRTTTSMLMLALLLEFKLIQSEVENIQKHEQKRDESVISLEDLPCWNAEVINDNTGSPLSEIPLCEVFRKTDNNEPVCYKHYNDATSSIDLMIGYSDPAAVIPDADCKSTVTFDPSQKWSYVNDVDVFNGEGYVATDPFKTPKKSIRTYATFLAKSIDIVPVVTGTSGFNVLSIEDVPAPMFVYITCTGELEPLEYSEFWGNEVFMSIITVNRIDAPVFCAALDALAPTLSPSKTPTRKPSRQLTVAPSAARSFAPTRRPSTSPSIKPSGKPSSLPPSKKPSTSPSVAPSISRKPISFPSIPPTCAPSSRPSSHPSSQIPSPKPTSRPQWQHRSKRPTANPSSKPSRYRRWLERTSKSPTI